MELTDVEGLASSIIREFLSRKKCKETLRTLDEEFPRKENSINNRTKLSQTLYIEGWMQKNKTLPTPFRTMLEVILHNVLMTNKQDDVSNVAPKLLPSDDRQRSLNKSPLERPLSAPVSAVKPGRLAGNKINNSLYVESLDDVDPVDTKQKNDALVKPVKLAMSASEVKYSGNNSRKASHPSSRTQFTMDDDLRMDRDFRINAQKQIANPQFDFDKMTLDDKLEKLKTTSVLEMLSATPDKPLRSSGKQNKVFSENNFDQSCNKSDAKNFRNTNSPGANIFSNSQVSKACVLYDFDVAKTLKSLIFGSPKQSFSSEWLDQNLSFSSVDFDRPDDLRYGIIQKKGGPCGVLAAIQAILLKHLIFISGVNRAPKTRLKVSDKTRTDCLAETVSEILWRAGDETSASFAVLSPRQQFSIDVHSYRPDGVTECITLLNFTTFLDLKAAVQKHIKSYECGKAGCILLLYSAILSRGIDAVKADFDEEDGKLLGAHGYCTQEMINLLLDGRATSNAFDGTVKLDQHTVLKGVRRRAEVGLLSLFEHYGSCKIGENYKTPKYPIWLICSESHFTVLFALEKDLVSSSGSKSMFDLYYYDGLARQDEVINLSVDLVNKASDYEIKGDLVPPLEHCIRTKWPRAKVNWNATDPIL
ncbi:putative ubiquitin carboxyl-terminal hydrolase MINDY-4 [Clavelina lepadiformis]|uniref:putative ubiquitin carboxyl-terminal hydrolase MINDY-4 n=1 Tax=Clavelina lepadiformis TaxID=159417 RepID=UPI0040417B02